MNIKNYTSSVPVIRSINYIEDKLIAAGATHIAKSYKEGKADGIIFQIMENDVPVTFKLPAKIDQVKQHFLKRNNKKRLTKAQVENLMLQAERTAWKILSDLVDIRISYVMIESADFVEMFLSDAFNGQDTLYERIKESGFKQLTMGNQQ
jgi:hypothetical protein